MPANRDPETDAIRQRAELADAAKLLALILSDCEGTDAHSWRKCRRCLALHELENHQPLAVRLVQQAIDGLSRLAVQERLYHELLYEVASKYPGASRHETARRYIREREQRVSVPSVSSAALAPPPEEP